MFNSTFVFQCLSDSENYGLVMCISKKKRLVGINPFHFTVKTVEAGQLTPWSTGVQKGTDSHFGSVSSKVHPREAWPHKASLAGLHRCSEKGPLAQRG